MTCVDFWHQVLFFGNLQNVGQMNDVVKRLIGTTF
jgi:hypothetical protein